MLSEDLAQVKIIDFGYSSPLTLEDLQFESPYLQNRLNGTRNYAAPELYPSKIN